MAGFANTTHNVTVQAGQTTQATIVMVALANAGAFHVTSVKVGSVTCTVQTKPEVSVSPPCPSLSSPNNPETYYLRWDLAAPFQDLQGIVSETTWRPSQMFGSALRTAWAFGTGDGGDCGQSMGEWSGKSPMKQAFGADFMDRMRANMTAACKTEAPCVEPTCRLYGQFFGAADTLGPSSLVDFGVTIDQRFEEYLTQFYGAPPAADFTALADG